MTFFCLFGAPENFFGNLICCCYLSQPLWDSGPESRRSSWTSIGRAPSLHRKSQSGEMESLLSDMHSGSNPSSREQSLDQQEYLQVPLLLPPDCNGTTFHLPDHCYDDTPLTTYYHSDQEEEEIEEVMLLCSFCFKMSSCLSDSCKNPEKSHFDGVSLQFFTVSKFIKTCLGVFKSSKSAAANYLYGGINSNLGVLRHLCNFGNI